MPTQSTWPSWLQQKGRKKWSCLCRQTHGRFSCFSRRDVAPLRPRLAPQGRVAPRERRCKRLGRAARVRGRASRRVARARAPSSSEIRSDQAIWDISGLSCSGRTHSPSPPPSGWGSGCGNPGTRCATLPWELNWWELNCQRGKTRKQKTKNKKQARAHSQPNPRKKLNHCTQFGTHFKHHDRHEDELSSSRRLSQTATCRLPQAQPPHGLRRAAEL